MSELRFALFSIFPLAVPREIQLTIPHHDDKRTYGDFLPLTTTTDEEDDDKKNEDDDG